MAGRRVLAGALMLLRRQTAMIGQAVMPLTNCWHQAAVVAVSMCFWYADLKRHPLPAASCESTGGMAW
jgi:hypothetical protein